MKVLRKFAIIWDVIIDFFYSMKAYSARAVEYTDSSSVEG